MTDYVLTLSTTDPNNHVGLIKIRQSDVNSQILNVTSVTNNKPTDFNGLLVFFKTRWSDGSVIKEKVLDVDYAKSRFSFMMTPNTWKRLGPVNAWFSFERPDKTVVESTKNFQYTVFEGDCNDIPQGNYIYEFEEIARKGNEILAAGDFSPMIKDIEALQLDKAEQIPTQKALSELSATKAEQEYVDEKFKSIGTGTPVDTLTSFAELTAKYPNGAEGPVVVLEIDGETGYVYIFDYISKQWKKGALYQAKGIANGSITIEKMNGKKMYNILPSNPIFWNPFRIAFEVGKSIQFNQKPNSVEDFYYEQLKGMGICTHYQPVKDDQFYIVNGFDTYMAILEFDNEGKGVKDSGWITQNGFYEKQPDTKQIAVSIRKKNINDFINIKNDQLILKNSMLLAENSMIDDSIIYTDNNIFPDQSKVFEGAYLAINGVEINYSNSKQRIVFKEIEVNQYNNYIIEFDRKDIFDIGVMLLDENNIAIQDSGWQGQDLDFKPTTNTKKISINIRYKDDKLINISEFYRVNLRILSKNKSESKTIEETVKKIDLNNLMGSYDLDSFENGTLGGLTADRKTKITKNNQVGRVRTRIPIKLIGDKSYCFDINCPDEFRYSLQICDVDDFHLFDSGWFEGSYHIKMTEDVNVWLIFKNQETDLGMTKDDISSFTFNVSIKEREQRLFLKDAYNFYAAHRGANEFAPENTLASISEAKKHGFDFVEFDVQLTKDNKPIIMHDDTVNRMTNGTGKVNELTYDEIKQLKIVSGNGLENYPNEIVPTFEQILYQCKIDRVIPLVHFNYMNNLRDCDVIINILRKMDMIQKNFMIPPGNQALMRLKKRAPKLLAGFVLTDYLNGQVDIKRILAFENIGVASWFSPEMETSKTWIESLKNHGVITNGYVINDVVLSNVAFSVGIDIVTTDKSQIIT